jgi:hypothetical protein
LGQNKKSSYNYVFYIPISGDNLSKDELLEDDPDVIPTPLPK